MSGGGPFFGGGPRFPGAPPVGAIGGPPGYGVGEHPRGTSTTGVTLPSAIGSVQLLRYDGARPDVAEHVTFHVGRLPDTLGVKPAAELDVTTHVRAEWETGLARWVAPIDLRFGATAFSLRCTSARLYLVRTAPGSADVTFQASASPHSPYIPETRRTERATIPGPGPGNVLFELPPFASSVTVYLRAPVGVAPVPVLMRWLDGSSTDLGGWWQDAAGGPIPRVPVPGGARELNVDSPSAIEVICVWDLAT